VTRHDLQRLADVTAAITAIREHLLRGDISDGLIFDAVRVRLIEIGEARSLPAPLRTIFRNWRRLWLGCASEQ